jgi:RNA polymerase sigma-70 factor (ECF subfamily)
LSLVNFVGFLAERQVASILRNGRRSPWTEDPTLNEDLVDLSPNVPGPDLSLASRELLEVLLERLRLELSPLGMQLFQLLFVEEKSTEDIRAITGMQTDAVYAWRSRLGKRVRRLAAELDAAGQELSAAVSGSSGSTRNPLGRA